MIKSNLISTTKLSDGKTTIDLTKLTENYNKENMKKCSNVICCDKISNGQEVFDLSQLGTSIDMESEYMIEYRITDGNGTSEKITKRNKY